MNKLLIIKKLNKNQKGIGLIEVIVSLGISTLIITSLISLNIFTLRSSLRSTLSTEAISSNTKQIELVRAFRDVNSWTYFIESMNLCISNTTNKEPRCYMYADSSGITFREGPVPTIQNMNPDQVSVGFYVESIQGTNNINDNVVSIVSVSQYKDGPQLKKVTLQADFTNWQSR